MKVFDCFTFFNEVELLEIRLHELAGVVDRFVLVEATATHAGQPRDLVFDPGDPRWAPFRDKIVHVVVDDFPARTDAWGRENYQRMAILRGLDRPGPDGQPLCGPLDLVIVSDVDEILNAATVAGLRDTLVKGVAKIELAMFNYFANTRAYRADEHDRPGQPSGPWEVWDRVRAVRRAEMRTPQQLRDMEQGFSQTVRNGGWHFTFLGGAERIRTKLEAFAHQELNRPEFTDLAHLEAALSEGGDIFSRGDSIRLATLALDETFPAHLRANADRFAHLIKGEAAVVPEGATPTHNPQTWMPDVWGWLVENYRPQRVLEIGCADGTNLVWFAERGMSTLGLERQPVMLEDGPLPAVVHDFADGPWTPAPPFDLCLCTDFVQHVAPEHEEHLQAAFRGCRSLLLAYPAEEGGDPWERKEKRWVKLARKAGLEHVPAATEGLRRTIEWAPDAPLRRSLLWFLRSDDPPGQRQAD